MAAEDTTPVYLGDACAVCINGGETVTQSIIAIMNIAAILKDVPLLILTSFSKVVVPP